MARQREIQVVMRERTGLLRKAGTAFLVMAVIVASVAVLIGVFGGGPPAELFAVCLILAGMGVGLALVDFALRMAGQGVRRSWRNLRERRTLRHDPAAIRARIEALEREIEGLRRRLEGDQERTAEGSEVRA